MRKTTLARARVCAAFTALTLMASAVVCTATSPAEARPAPSAVRGADLFEPSYIAKAFRKAPSRKAKAPKGDPKAKVGDAKKKKKKDDGPVQPGEPSEVAAQAKRLYSSGKLYDAAKALYRVSSGETGDDEGNKQLAQFDLAKTFYALKYYQASYGIFSEIADKPDHIKFNETLLWLAKLATELPESADIIERVGKYDEDHISQFKNNAEQRELYWQLNYLLGRYKYRTAQYNDALALFSKVSPESKYYVQAQFFSGISHVQQRESIPAVKSFQRILSTLASGATGVEDDARMRDLAYLSIARTFYAKSIHLDEATNAPAISPVHLKVAVDHWNSVDVASEYWLDALFEESWAYFMKGDYSRALGNIHTIQSPYFPNSYYPEAEVLKAVIYFYNCKYDDADLITKRFREKYEPIQAELSKVLEKFGGNNQEEAFYNFLKEVNCSLQAKSGTAPASCAGVKDAALTPAVKPIIEISLSDRQLLRTLRYVDVLDDEHGRFKRSSTAFQESKVGASIKDSLHDAREGAIRNAGELAKGRYQRNLDELTEHLRNATKIAIDVIQAQRSQLDQALVGSQVTAQESEANIVKPDEEHVIWPFDGEYWRDELGFYRQTITSKCGR